MKEGRGVRSYQRRHSVKLPAFFSLILRVEDKGDKAGCSTPSTTTAKRLRSLCKKRPALKCRVNWHFLLHLPGRRQAGTGRRAGRQAGWQAGQKDRHDEEDEAEDEDTR